MSRASDGGPVEVRTTFATMKRQFGFSERDAHCLWTLRDFAQPHFPTLARDLLDLAREQGLTEDAHPSEPLQAERQVIRWIERVLVGPYDEDFCRKAAQTAGQLVAAAVPANSVIVAVARVRLALHSLAQRALPAEASQVSAAVSRILDIEMALLLETYRALEAGRIRHLEGEQAWLRAVDDTSKIAQAVELAQAMIVVLDERGHIELFNREAERITGCSRSEALGTCFQDSFLAAADESGWTESLEAVLSLDDAATSIPTSFVIHSRSGNYRRIEGRLNRGPAALVFVVGRDVTDEKALAARLRRSEKLAAVGTLAAGLAHEIRNPLNGAQLHVTFLRRALGKGLVNEDVLDAVGVVQAEIARLSALVTDFLSFARPRHLNRQAISLHELCHRSANMTRAEADTAGAELVLELPEESLELEVDDAMIEQVLLNLIRNAVDAVRIGAGGQVTLKAYGRPFHAVIEVHDDGCGLHNPEAPIFDAFYSSKPDGTGLGLAIAHRIISDHGGTIEFDSRPGRTVFRTTLPLRDPEHVPASIAHPSRLRGSPS